MNKRDTIPMALAGRRVKAAVCVTTKECPGSKVCEPELDADSVSALISFFRLLDNWDREAKKQ